MKKAGLICNLALLTAFVILQAQNEGKPVNDTLAVIETAMNYGDGFLGGSGERMEKALFPDLMKLAVTKLPNSDKSILIQSTVSGLVEMKEAEQDAFKQAAANTVLGANGQIQTGDDGRVRLDLSSGTIIRVSPSSLFTLTSNEEVEGGLFTKISLEAGKIIITLLQGRKHVLYLFYGHRGI